MGNWLFQVINSMSAAQWINRDSCKYRSLRNNVNCTVAELCRCFYVVKRRGLQICDSRTCWKDTHQFTGQKSPSADIMGMANQVAACQSCCRNQHILPECVQPYNHTSECNHTTTARWHVSTSVLLHYLYQTSATWSEDCQTTTSGRHTITTRSTATLGAA